MSKSTSFLLLLTPVFSLPQLNEHQILHANAVAQTTNAQIHNAHLHSVNTPEGIKTAQAQIAQQLGATSMLENGQTELEASVDEATERGLKEMEQAQEELMKAHEEALNRPHPGLHGEIMTTASSQTVETGQKESEGDSSGGDEEGGGEEEEDVPFVGSGSSDLSSSRPKEGTQSGPSSDGTLSASSAGRPIAILGAVVCTLASVMAL